MIFVIKPNFDCSIVAIIQWASDEYVYTDTIDKNVDTDEIKRKNNIKRGIKLW